MENLWKICAKSGEEFPIFKSHIVFYETIAPTFMVPLDKGGSGANSEAGGFVKFQLPTPTICPEERDRRRLAFRNERQLYKRQCAASGKIIISTFVPDKNIQVYDQKIWRGDTWNALDYAMIFDHNKTFTEQYKQLLYAVPHQALIGANNENADYINLTADSKNYYMVIESSNNEDCYYGYWLQKCKDLADCSYCHGCEFSYELQNCRDCMHSRWMTDCQNCSHCDYMYNCYNCRDCIGCVNLVNKQYCINNVQYSEEEYRTQSKEFRKPVILSGMKGSEGSSTDIVTSSIARSIGDNKPNNIYTSPRFASSKGQKIKEQFHKLIQSSPRQYAHATQTEHSFGDYMHNTKNCRICYDVYDAENCRYGEHVWRNAKNIMDVSTVGRDAQRVYECINTGIGASNNLFCAICRSSSNMIYCQECFNCQNCFGCTGLTNKEYCIFNKQYTKETYEQEVAKIIQTMQQTNERGQFFHPSLSLYGYNETVAHEQFPLTKSQAKSLGFAWHDEQTTDYSGLQTIDPTTLPQNIHEISDTILQQVLVCHKTRKPYRITKQELNLYRRLDISIPILHPDVRHSQRVAQRPPRILHWRACDESGQEIISVYTRNTPFPVYCEDEYKKIMFG